MWVFVGGGGEDGGGVVGLEGVGFGVEVGFGEVGGSGGEGALGGVAKGFVFYS